jgi:hypothetical protein
MQMRLRSTPLTVAVAAMILLSMLVLPNFSATPASAKEDPFTRTWARTDWPVANQRAIRTWMWGEKAYSQRMTEHYEEAPNHERTVLYWDKSRMEDNSFNTTDAPWDVSNGLLVVEMVSGRLQVGDSAFENRTPAQENIAGDADDTNGPTYAAIAGLLDAAPVADGSTITQRISRNGAITNDPGMASYGVTAAWHERQPGLDHQVASVFWAFMNSEGSVYEDGRIFDDKLFESPFYATGLPITEAYWADVKVAGTVKSVLIQCFERRCLTYTPSNDSNWRVEAGNVGRQYFQWRYGAPPGETPSDADDNRTLSVGQSLNGTIDPQTDQDTYYFDGAAGQRFSIEMSRIDDSTLDSVLSLYAPDGSLVNDPGADDDNGWNTNALIHNARLPVSGRYRIVAESYNATSSGSYSITLRPDDGSPTEGSVVYASTLRDWAVDENEAVRWYVANNTYHILVKQNTQQLAWNQTTDHGDISDFSASVYVRRVSPASNSDGCLIVRSSLGSDAGAFYRFCLLGNGRETYADFVSGGAIQSTLLPAQDRLATNNPGEWNKLEIMVSGSHFWFYINGVLVGDAVHAGPQQGAVGVLVAAYDNNPAEFEFFNLVVRSVSGP